MVEEASSVNDEDKFLSLILTVFKKQHDEGWYNSKFSPEVAVAYMNRFNLAQEAPNAYDNLKKLCGTPSDYGEKSVIYLYSSDRIKTNADFVKEMVKEYITMHEADDQQKYAGRLFWNLLKRCDLDKKQYEGLSQKSFYKKNDVFERDKVEILSGFAHKMSVEDRIKAMDWFLSYKKTDRSGVYGLLIGKMAYYDIGETKENRDWVVANTLKLLNQVNNKTKGQNSADLMELALPILENAALNSYYLQGKTFVDNDGKIGPKHVVYDFGDNVRQSISEKLKKNKIQYSDDLGVFLEGEDSSTDTLIKKMNIINKSVIGQRSVSTSEIRKYNTRANAIYAQLNDGNVTPTNKLVRTYAEYLSGYAKINSYSKDVDAKLLERLINENANYMELNTEVGILFDDMTPKKEKRSVNKNLVEDIAQIYTSSVLTTNDMSSEFNENFHRSMTNMFINIVINNKYTKKEVDKLSEILAKGGNNAPEFATMGRSVKTAYNRMLASRAKMKKIY